LAPCSRCQNRKATTSCLWLRGSCDDCGVRVPHSKGVLAIPRRLRLHYLVDGQSRALAYGVYRSHFPPSDPSNGAASGPVPEIRPSIGPARVRRVAHLDGTLICRRPKIRRCAYHARPHRRDHRLRCRGGGEGDHHRTAWIHRREESSPPSRPRPFASLDRLNERQRPRHLSLSPTLGGGPRLCRQKKKKKKTFWGQLTVATAESCPGVWSLVALTGYSVPPT